MRLRSAALAVLVPLAPAAARAQGRPRAVAQTLATNPLILPFGLASAEYERAVGRGGFAVGVGGLTGVATGDGSALDRGERYQTLQAKLKYYPREDGLRGFAIGVTAGVAHARSVEQQTLTYVGEGFSSTTITSSYRSRTAPTLGVVVDYNLLIGRQRRFLIGLGVGAKRTLDRRPSGDALGRTLVDPRLQFGFGF